MTTVKSQKTLNTYTVSVQLYGTRNNHYTLSMGGIKLASYYDCPPANADIRTLEDAVAYADTRAMEMAIAV